MSSGKNSGLGKFVVGAAIGAGLGLLFAPKKGSETRKQLKEKLDDFISQVKQIDVEDVKKEFDLKVQEIKDELAELDKEKVLDMAKKKGNDLSKKAQELVDLARDKGTPVLKKGAEDVLENVKKVTNEVLKKLERKN